VKRGAMAAGLAADKIEIIVNEPDAVDYALHQGSKGDLVLITADKIQRTFEQITKFRDERGSAVGV